MTGDTARLGVEEVARTHDLKGPKVGRVRTVVVVAHNGKPS